MNNYILVTTIGAGHVVGAALIGLIVGLVLSFVFYSPEKRAVTKVEEIIKSREAALKVTVFRDRSAFSTDFAAGVTHLLTRLKADVADIKAKL